MTYRVLLICDTFPPMIGGAGHDTRLLSNELVKRGHHVTVAAGWFPGLLEEEDDPEAAARVYRIKRWRKHLLPFPDPTSVRQLRRLIAHVRPDLVHAFGRISYSCAAALLGRDIPLLISARDYTHVCPTATLLRVMQGGTEICSGASLGKCLDCAARSCGSRWSGTVVVAGVFGCRGLLRRKIDGLHCCSTYVEEVTTDRLLGNRRGRSGQQLPVRAIPSFHSDTEDEPADQRLLDRLPPEPFILFVGMLRSIKGLVPLCEAYQRLAAAPPLVLLGPPEPDMPRAFPPGTVVLPGAPHGTVMGAWERALFGVAPSISPEPLGNVIHEAMSKGKAVVGTIPGGMRDMIVDGETGFLVPAGDVPALVNAMQRLIDDAALRERMGQSARERAQRFTAQVLMPQFEALYDEVVQAARSRHQSGG